MKEQKQGKRITKNVSDYVVFDFETTGISDTNDDIIEISAVKVKKNKVVDTFSTLVNPQRRIPASATRVNGITDQMVANAPTLEEALPEFLKFVDGFVLVGHNIHTFDMKFLNIATDDLYGTMVSNDYIDTLYMARRCLPELSHHRLTDLAEYFHFSTEGAHRALNDCIMNQKCYESMKQIQESDPVVICPECGAEMVKRNSRYGLFYGCSNYPNCKKTKKI